MNYEARSTFRPVSRGKGKRSRVLVKAAYNILQEIHPASVRAVCYRLFVAGLVQDMSKANTNCVSRLLRIAREEEEIPWEWIVDESREAETISAWRDTAALIDAAVKQYRRDYWQDQDTRVEVWSEKGTVRGTLGPVLNEYGVTFRVMHGYASATAINTVVEEAAGAGKALVVLYVGDWDPSGLHISEADIPRRIEKYSERFGGGNIQVKRIALYLGDLHELPDFHPDTKIKDPRYQWFKREIGTLCYELDAMPPPALRSRVETEIRACIDLERWEDAIKVERVERESMENFRKSWQASLCRIQL
jgi:hypothetical protein